MIRLFVSSQFLTYFSSLLQIFSSSSIFLCIWFHLQKGRIQFVLLSFLYIIYVEQEKNRSQYTALWYPTINLFNSSENVLPILTVCFLFLLLIIKYDSNHCFAIPLIPQFSSQSNKILWFTVSSILEKSNSTLHAQLPLSKLLTILVNISTTAKVVDSFFRIQHVVEYWFY